MSLLLDALKKAERAKEEAQRRAKGADAADAAASPTGANFDPNATVVDSRHVTTRNELPDISAPLEILSSDLRPAAASKPALELSLAEPMSPAPPPAEPERRESQRRGASRGGEAPGAEAANAERVAAQKVFEAKFKEPNPRLPFYITMGVLAAFAIGTVVYFWIQLRPPPPLVNTSPSRAPDEKPVEAAATKPAAPAAPAATAQAPAGIPGLPGSAPATTTSTAGSAPPAAAAAKPAAAAPAPAPAAAIAKPPAVAASRPAARPRPAPEERADERPVSVTRVGPQIHPQVAAGYAAYQGGDLAKARAEYQQALRDEPSNRDALLGLAAVEMRAQRYGLADAYYQRVLQIDPRDPHAQAGQYALRSQQLDPVQVESRVKSLLANDREANVLYFTLGNQYAQQGRWAEAQQSYFKAFAANPDNADFAFNLAVSLDQLRQSKLALEYYRRALSLAEQRGASFDADVARTRVQQLSR